MEEIKIEFFRIVFDDLDKNEKYISENGKQQVAQYRWEKFISFFMKEFKIELFAKGLDNT